MLRRVCLGVLVAVPLMWSNAAAQTAQKFSIQASALGVQLTGIENQELAFGGGGEIQLRYNPSRFSIGVGGQTTVHEVGVNSVTFQGVFVEPRYVLAAVSDVVGIYAAVRFMTLNATFDVLGSEVAFDGSALSGGGGLLIRLGSRLNGDLGVTVGKETYSGERSEGVTVVTRLGLALGLG